MKKKLAIFGSTGSIGTQALEVIDETNLATVHLLSANNSYKKLASQVNKYKPEYVVLGDESHRKEFESLLIHKPATIGYGISELNALAESADYDILLNSLVGFAGFKSTYQALKRGKRVALANKESLVAGGDLISKLPAFKSGNLIPVDSEHSAMLQCLIGEDVDDIQRIIITASGGPFRNFTREQMETIRVEDALNHPNWEMGSKITVDSSTMMNKGLEIIEAKWFFDLEIDQILPVVHPQSILHSIVEFKDGSSKAQMGPPDMKVPILYSLTYPKRVSFNNPVLDYSERIRMDIEPVDFERFPCLNLAIESIRQGGCKPAVLNASNEVAVERFLKEEIRYIEIPEIIEKSLEKIHTDSTLSPDTLLQADLETRKFAQSYLR